VAIIFVIPVKMGIQTNISESKWLNLGGKENTTPRGAKSRRCAIPKGLRMLDKAFREEVHNLQLARLLAQQGIVSFPETIDQNVEGARRMPDVLVEFQGLRTIIEGKVDDQPGAMENVHDDAYRRVAEGLAHIGIAVLYPERTKSHT
jgi:hypothetical protein